MVKTCGQNMSITPENLFNILILLGILIQSQWAWELGMLNVGRGMRSDTSYNKLRAGVRELECKWWDIFSSGLTLHLCNKSANGRPGKWFIHQSEGLNCVSWPMRGLWVVTVSDLSRCDEWWRLGWWAGWGDLQSPHIWRLVPGLSSVSLPVVSEEITCHMSQ